MPDHLLLIAYHFGPGASTGANRWNAMGEALLDAGWSLHVLTAARPGLTTTPRPGLTVHPVPAPSGLVPLLERLQAWRHGAPPEAPSAPPAAPLRPEDFVLGHPGRPTGLKSRTLRTLDDLIRIHPDWAWARRVLHAGRRLGRTTAFRAVITSSPPHLAQIAGDRLASDLGVPHIPDFRDPWVLGRPDSTTFNVVEGMLGARHEARIFRNARLVLANTERARAAAIAVSGPPSINAVALPNGYDHRPASGSPDRTRFRIVFAGWLYPFMDVRPVFAAARRLIDAGRLTPAELAIEFMGPEESYGGHTLGDLARAYGLAGQFTLHRPGSRDQALALQQRAAVLLIFDYPHPFAVPTKFYDQSALAGVMLPIGNPTGALADAAARIGLTVHAAGDVDGVTRSLDAALTRWRAGDVHGPADRAGVFDRKLQSARLVQLLDDALRAPNASLSARNGLSTTK